MSKMESLEESSHQGEVEPQMIQEVQELALQG